MAFADPQSITVNTVAKTLNLIKNDGLRSEYVTADEEYKFVISHQESGKRTRRMVRVDHRVVATDPLSSVNEYKNLGVYLVIDEPEYGFTDDAIYDVLAGLLAWMTEANALKLLSGQH